VKLNYGYINKFKLQKQHTVDSNKSVELIGIKSNKESNSSLHIQDDLKIKIRSIITI
jgi:hypothetical protein